jgi:hypothetical protein
MGCTESKGKRNEFTIIEEEYKELIDSVKKEIDQYQNQINQIIKNSKNVKEINFKFDQEILSIIRNYDSYWYSTKPYLNKFLKNNRLDNAQECINDKEILNALNNKAIIKIKEIEAQRVKKINNAEKYLINEELEEYNKLKEKIESCKKQIHTYENEKQAAIIAKREEKRHKLLYNNMNNGILPLYDERHGFNEAINNKIVKQIHKDWQ